MKIRTRLHLIILILFVFEIGVVLAVIAANQRVDQARARADGVQSVMDTLFRLNHLSFEYLKHPDAGLSAQWRAEQAELDGRLQAFAMVSLEEKAIVASLQQNLEQSLNIFDQLWGLDRAAGMAEGREILSGQLLLNIQAMASGWFQLDALMRRQISAAQRPSNLAFAILLAGAGLMAVIAMGAFLFSRSILTPLDALRKSVEIIGSGNLDYRVGLETQDEIGELSRAFERMAENLRRMKAEFVQTSSYTRSLIEASLDPLVTISPEGKITDVNKATEEATGLSRNDLVGTDFSAYFTELENAHAGYQKVLEQGYVRDYPLTLKHTSGKTIDVLYNASVYRNEKGEVAGVFAAARDITEREWAEAMRLQMAAIVESSNDAIIGKTPEGIITSWNKGAEKIYGYSADEIIGKSMTTHVPSSAHAEIYELMEKIRKGETVVNHEFVGVRKDGALIRVALTLSPIKDASGRINGISTIARDITDKKRLEEKLNQASVYNRSLIEASLDPLVTISPEGKITDVNKATEKVTGRGRVELIGTDFSDYFTEPDKAREGYTKVFMQGSVIDYPLAIRHKNGSIIDVLYNASVYRNEVGVVLGVFAAARDITQRKQDEEKLRIASLYARSLIEASLDPLVTISADGKVTDVNQATVRATGVTREQLIGSDFSDYFTEPDKARAGYREVFSEGFVTDYPLAIRHVSGSIMEVMYNASVYNNEKGAVEGVFAAARDITQRKRAEQALQQLNAELEHRVLQRTVELEAANRELEAFAYSVSHDLRAPLRSIDGFSLALLEDYADKVDDEGKDYLQRVRAASQRMAQLIDDILNLSRVTRSELVRQEVDLSELARSVVAELQHGQPGRQVEMTIQDGMMADGDSRLLHVVLANLIGNAWKYTSRHPTAHIEFGCTDIEGSPAFFVRDDGAGFDMEYAAKLFSAFQRLHSPDEFPGNGIGLALVQRIIRRHGGSVWAEGAVEQGATFYFRLA